MNFENLDESCQSFLKKNTCKVCGKGAVLYSYILKNNNWNMAQLKRSDYDLDKDGSTPEDILEIFGRELLDDIEMVFELCVYDWHYTKPEFEFSSTTDWGYDIGISKEEYDRCVKFINHFKIYKDENARLTAIMENIVRNNGELVV